MAGWKALVSYGKEIDCRECFYGKTCNVANAHGFRVGSCSCYSPNKKQTNSDRIRSMTDVELANWITLVMWGEESSVPFLYAETPEKWLDWLKQEVRDA